MLLLTGGPLTLKHRKAQPPGYLDHRLCETDSRRGQPTGGVLLTVSGLTDDVVAAAGRGDGSAFRAIYESLAPAVLGYLKAKGVTDPEAVTSDVFIALLPKLDRVTGGAAGLRKLVFCVAHARLVDDFRERARRPQAVQYAPDADRRTVASAEESAQAALAIERVIEVLDILPVDQREVLLLRVVADLSVAQVAEIIGRSVGAVKQLQRRGLVAIRQALEVRQVSL
jgi:RNA polymerase sigma factor (sigma-70 family)